MLAQFRVHGDGNERGLSGRREFVAGTAAGCREDAGR
jgi:hypothetical protein